VDLLQGNSQNPFT